MDVSETAKKRAAFLAHLRETCNVGKSAEAAGVGRATIYQWRNEDPKFEEQIRQAKKDAVEALEDEVHRRAFEGTLVATKAGVFKQYSDTLAIFLLKAHDGKYKDTVRNELTGANGEPLDMGDDKIASRLDAIMQAVAKRRNQETKPQEAEPVEDHNEESELVSAAFMEPLDGTLEDDFSDLA